MADPAAQPRFDLRAELIASVDAAARALKDEDPNKAAHRARVAIKRARALARLARPTFPAAAKAFNDEARALMALLSAPRDEAAMAGAARLAAAGARPKAKNALNRIADEMEAHGAAEAVVALAAARDAVYRLALRARQVSALTAAGLQEGAAAMQARLAAAYDAAIQSHDPETRHTWRKRDKEAQLAAKALGPLWPGRTRLRAAAALAQALGAERDLLLLEEWLKARGAKMQPLRRTVRTARLVLGAHADTLAARAYR